MEFYQLGDKEEINSNEFLQSRPWAEILRVKGGEIRRVGVKGGDLKGGKGELLMTATLIKKSLGFGRFYWYAPRGPIFKDQSKLDLKLQNELISFFLAEVKKLDPRAIFIRIEPSAQLNPILDGLRVAGQWSIKKTIPVQPAKTLLLDLSTSEAELLAELHQKTRYNIHLAEKKGVVIKEADLRQPTAEKDFLEFWRLMKLTGARDSFRLHDEKHYRDLSTAGGGFIRLFFAVYEGKNIATGLFVFFGDKVTYLHGASDNEFRQVMAPYLLQWIVIKTAVASGFCFYDCYGIDDQRWPGGTCYKKGFGGQYCYWTATFDAVFRPTE